MRLRSEGAARFLPAVGIQGRESENVRAIRPAAQSLRVRAFELPLRRA